MFHPPPPSHFSPNQAPARRGYKMVVEASDYAAISPIVVANRAIVTNFLGKVANKSTTGGWRASRFIIVNEAAERMAYYTIAVSIVTYLVQEMHQSLPDAVTTVTAWVGAAFLITVFGAFVADSYLGRFWTIVIFTFIYAIGMFILTLSASIVGLLPPPCVNKVCKSATAHQMGVLYVALSLIGLGTAGIKACVSSFGADQFDDTDEKEARSKYSFFNWFFFAINLGVLIGMTLMVYVNVRKGWGWGFGVPTAAVVFSIIVFVAGTPFYRFQKPTGSAFTRFAQVVVAACRNHKIQVANAELYEVDTLHSDIVGARKLPHTPQFRFLDKAAFVKGKPFIGKTRISSRWSVCTVTQVEELKAFIRILPIWATNIALAVSLPQLTTFFISQATIMDRRLGPHYTVPQSSIGVFGTFFPLLLIPFYESVMVPFLRRHTGHHRGITSLQRMGVGLFISVFALGAAALIEKRRRDSALADSEQISFFWLLPQFFLIGTAEVFVYVGQLEFFYDEATDGTRSLSNSIFLTEIGVGSWVNTGLVKAVVRLTGGKENGWIRSDLNRSRLDYFYWILCGINVVNFFVYLVVASVYRGRDQDGGGGGGDEVFYGGRSPNSSRVTGSEPSTPVNLEMIKA